MGSFRTVLKAAPIIAAAGKSALHSVEAVPPGAGDAAYPAGTALAGGAPGTSRSSASKSSTSRSHTRRSGTSSSGTKRRGTSRSGTSRSNARRRPSAIQRRSTSVTRVVCSLHVCTHANYPMTRVVCRLMAGRFTPKLLRSTLNWPEN